MVNSRIAPRRSLYLVLLLVSAGPVEAQDWPRFRGPNGSGVSDAQRLPSEFGPEKNVVWNVRAEPGLSSPIVVGERLFYTSFEGDERTLHCLNTANGGTLWNRRVRKLRDENSTPPSGPATPTPAADGESVAVFFPDAGLFCYSNDGTERWRVQLPPFHSMHGICSSLILVDNKAILVVDQLADSYIAAYALDSGELCWKSERLSGLTGAYSTPSLFTPSDGPAQIIVAGPLELVAYDVGDGQRIWWLSGLTNAPVTLPVVSHDRVFICEPVGEPIPMSALGPVDKDNDGKVTLEEVQGNVSAHRLLERVDRDWGNGDAAVDDAEWDRAFGSFVGKGGLVSVALGGSGDITQTHVRWTYQRAVPYIASVLCYDGVLYFVRDGGILTTVDPASGDVLRTDRLTQATGQYYASPVAADGKVLLVNTAGKMTVLKAGRNWEVLATNDLGEPCHASPALSNGRIYVRTHESLFCFGTEDTGGASR